MREAYHSAGMQHGGLQVHPHGSIRDGLAPLKTAGWPAETQDYPTGSQVELEQDQEFRTESKYIQLTVRRWPGCHALGKLSYKQG